MIINRRNGWIEISSKVVSIRPENENIEIFIGTLNSDMINNKDLNVSYFQCVANEDRTYKTDNAGSKIYIRSLTNNDVNVQVLDGLEINPVNTTNTSPQKVNVMYKYELDVSTVQPNCAGFVKLFIDDNSIILDLDITTDDLVDKVFSIPQSVYDVIKGFEPLDTTIAGVSDVRCMANVAMYDDAGIIKVALKDIAGISKYTFSKTLFNTINITILS